MASGGKGVGVPLKLLHESEGHIITVRTCKSPAQNTREANNPNNPLLLQMELKTGETYRGTLLEAEDNWNSQLKDITATGRVRFILQINIISWAFDTGLHLKPLSNIQDGRVYELENVFIRGSKIRCVLKHKKLAFIFYLF